MAMWLLIVVGAFALGAGVVAVVIVVVLASVLPGRARAGGAINPHNDPGVQPAHAHAERTNIHHNFGDTGPGI